MTKDPNKNPQHTENFDLEEVVLNTNQNKVGNTPAEITDAEIVKKMQQSTSNTTPTENLDTVVMKEKKTTITNKSGTSNTRENKLKKEREEQTANNTETIDDILIEEDNERKNRSRILALIIIILLVFGLIWLIKQSRSTDNNNPNNNIFTGSESDTGDSSKLNNFLNRNDGDNTNREELGGEYSYNTEENTIYYKNFAMKDTDRESFEVLAKEYAKDKHGIYYKGILIPNVETDKFKVIEESGNHKLTGVIVTSKNLLEHLKIKKNREFLMTTIASITNKNQNVKDELTHASVYAMDGFQDDFDELNELQRGDDMTDLQRAKFGVIFLYIKIIKSLETDQIRMSKAKAELQYFIEHSDEVLEIYGPETEKKTSLQGDIGYDEYCVYADGKLSTCFLNNIFINKD